MIRRSSLRCKLGAIVIGITTVFGVVATIGFGWRDLRARWERNAAEVSAMGAIVEDQAGAAVLLGDTRAAGNIVASLRADDRVSDAVIYTAGGRCFAEFHRSEGSHCPPCPPDGTHREHSVLVQTRPVMAGGERAGTLSVRIDVPGITAMLRNSLPAFAVIIGYSLLIAITLMVALEARVSFPVLSIARVAQRMAESHMFSERVILTSEDEIGVLARSFNLMLDEIERRDSELARQRRQLEAEVAERSRVNTALLEAKDRAENADRLKTEFLANMSHEIRTPMNGIIGMISLVLDRCADSEQQEQLHAAQQAAQALTALLNDILDLSRIEADKLKIESIAFDLHASVRDTLRTFAVTMREKALELRLVISPDGPVWVRGDPVRLRQVLMNLIGNAVKFTMRGRVEVDISVNDGNLLRMEVRDSGIGIPKEMLSAIFEPFTQADGSHARRFGGSGLGLAITRRLVHLMKGHISAESEPGRGSRFTVELPFEACVGPAAGQESAAKRPERSIPGLRILVAEDNLINQKVVCAMLERQGWSVTLARDGQDAFDAFKRDRFDLILMDVQMPGMDGLESTCRIRREERRRQMTPTPIIALTAHASRAQHNECLQEGMDAVITKPVNLPELLDKIFAMLDATGRAPELTSG